MTNNQLKLLALLSMTLDHIGVQLLPQYPILRILGRFALPIFAYMIAEGCAHTKNRHRYLVQMAGLALGCQLVYFFAMGSLYQCILVTFSLSILLIYAFDTGRPAVMLPALAGAYFLTELLPKLLPATDYAVDYGFFGVLLPVLIHLGQYKWEKLLWCAAGLFVLALIYGGVQWYGLLGLLPLALYNGKRGTRRVKWLFYWYYPLHLAVIYGVSLLL